MFRSLRTSHVEFRFPVSENLGTSRNGRMEQNFPVIPIFRNFRPTSRGTPKISEWNSGKCLFHSLPNPGFPEFLVEWKAPTIFGLLRGGKGSQSSLSGESPATNAVSLSEPFRHILVALYVALLWALREIHWPWFDVDWKGCSIQFTKFNLLSEMLR